MKKYLNLWSLIGFIFFCILIFILFWFRQDKADQNKTQDSRFVTISDQILKSHPITNSKIVEIEPYNEFVLVGRIQRDPTQTVTITARTQGRVIKVNVQESDEVKINQLLAVIQSTQVAQVQANHLKLLLKFDLSRKQMDRATDLFKHQILSAKEYEIDVMEFETAKTELDASRVSLKHLNLTDKEIKKLEKNRTHLGELEIRSPIDGVVIERKIALGESVEEEKSIFAIGKTNHIWIVLDVYEKDLPFLTEGMPAELLIPTQNGQTRKAQAKIVGISQEIDTVTRSAKAWLETDEAGIDFRLGQAISARIKGVHTQNINEIKKLKVIPIEAIHNIEGSSISFVQISEFKYQARKVEVGWTSDKWAEIKSGISNEELVAAQGSFILKSEYLKN